MSDSEFEALGAKVGARTAAPEERDAWKDEHARRHAEWFATQPMPPEKSLAERQRIKERVDRNLAQDEANRLTIEKYAEYLRLHAKDHTRTKAESLRYKALGKRHGLHGRPELVVHRRDRRPAPRLRRFAVRTPRARRFVRRARARAPGRKARGSDEPLDPPARVLYAHAARVADSRVASWLESWADEALGKIA